MKNSCNIELLIQINQLLCNFALQCLEVSKEYLLQSSGFCAFKQAERVRKIWSGGETGIGRLKTKIWGCKNMSYP